MDQSHLMNSDGLLYLGMSIGDQYEGGTLGGLVSLTHTTAPPANMALQITTSQDLQEVIKG